MRRSHKLARNELVWVFELTVMVFVIAAVFAMAMLPSGAAANHQIEVGEYFFNPPTITINVGDTVTWHNGGSLPHTATSNGSAWTSISLPVGSTSTPLAFNTPGTFPYHCALHPSLMWGSITVSGAIPEFSSGFFVVLGLMAMMVGLIAVRRRRT